MGEDKPEVRPQNPDLWDEMVVAALGPEWLDEPRFDQLVALIEHEGDSDAAVDDLEAVIGE